MESYQFLFDIALILFSTKLLGLFTRGLKMPQVVGSLLAGLMLGPAVLNILHGTDFIKKVSELGVIILMFTAGLETDVKELRRAGKASLIIAFAGVLLPLGGGFLIAHVFNRGDISSGNRLLQNVFIGVVLTATSVSITVETLRELGKLDTRVGSAILGAALIDDILGILALTVITSSTGGGAGIGLVLLRILLFFAFVAVTGFAFYKLFMRLIKLFKKDLRRFAVVAFVFCLLMAYCAEEFFGVADITGAYIAGLIICNTQKTKYIASRFDTLSFLLLSPIFFASIGIEVVLPQMSGNIILFTVLLLIVSILTKIVGCGLGAKACGYPGKESLQIGLGMIPRGEVTLIIAQKGVALGVMNTAFYGPIIIMVVVTAIVTPVLFKLAVGRQEGTDKYAGIVESPLVDRYRETEQFDLAQQVLLELHESLKGNSEDSEDKPN